MKENRGKMLQTPPDPTRLPPASQPAQPALNTPGGGPPREPEKEMTFEEIMEIQRRLPTANAPQKSPPPFPPSTPPRKEMEKDLLTPIDFGEDLSDIPVIEVSDNLPSGGAAYPEGFSIAYRPYVFGEIKKISGSKISFGELSRIILSGIRTSFPLGDLTYYDFLYLALLRKISTIGESTVVATHACPNCGTPNTYEINVSAKDSEIEFIPVRYKKLPLIVDLQLFGDDSPIPYKFKPVTIRQYLELESKGINNDPLSKLAASCVDAPFTETRSKFFRAQGVESKLLTRVEEALFHGIRPLNVDCGNSQCGAINKLHLERGEVIIRPFRGSEEALDDRIRYGEEVPHQPSPSE